MARRHNSPTTHPLALATTTAPHTLLLPMNDCAASRHPILRDPLPPPPVNFVARLPTRSDTML